MLTKSPLLALIFLMCCGILSGIATSLAQLGRTQTRTIFKKTAFLFYFQHLLKPLFKERKWEGLFFCLSMTKHLLQLLFATFAFIFLLFTPPLQDALAGSSPYEWFWLIFSALLIIIISLLVDFAANLLSSLTPFAFFKVFSSIASTCLLLSTPLTWPLFKLLKLFLPKSFKEKAFSASFQMKEKLLDILHESEISSYFDVHDKKLLLSVVSFKDRIAREVMVPRIDIFSLPAQATIKEAAEGFVKEGYSRIPIYKESIDQVIGTLLYKDILNAFIQGRDLNEPIETLIKPALYTPETKKLSLLLQEFRNKQTHLAIVVDEYGGTEGIVTIEDILEELVGEIADEYDYDEEILYSILPTGEWIVDAKMSIIDINEDLGIKIPQSSDYDTLGGYIFHRAGAIPTPGWRLHHDAFDLEVLSSTERSVEKVRITPHQEG